MSNNLMLITYVRLVLFAIIVGVFIFWPAGSLAYWEGWLYWLAFFGPTLVITAYFLKHDPALIERRNKVGEKEKAQRVFQTISGIVFFVGLLSLPGLDYRFNWSDVPAYLAIAADFIVILGFWVVFLVFQENTYTSSVIEVSEKQTVITTGPYALVRHPMYTGAVLIIVFTPLALGSYWGLLPALFISTMVIFRLLNEEKVLVRELEGYKTYCQKIRYHLIPFIW